MISVKKGQPVVRQGEVSNHFVFNRVGLFRVSHINGNTEDTVLFGSSGDVFTSLHSYYAGEPAIFTLSAVEDSEAWLIKLRRHAYAGRKASDTDQVDEPIADRTAVWIREALSLFYNQQVRTERTRFLRNF